MSGSSSPNSGSPSHHYCIGVGKRRHPYAVFVAIKRGPSGVLFSRCALCGLRMFMTGPAERWADFGYSFEMATKMNPAAMEYTELPPQGSD